MHPPRYALRRPAADARTLLLCAAAVGLGAAGAFFARVLMALIALITNLSYFGRWSFAAASPAGHALGAWAVLVPVAGALVVGVMARYGSAAIRGHGIPEAMEQVLTNASRIPPRLTLLKPVSAAVSIGTGGPFGAEGPIIATGGSLGSLVGQLFSVSPAERKTLLAAGAAAGMAATFGSPVSAVLLAVELLLFEYRVRSLVPVALASAVAACLRASAAGAAPVFAMPAAAPAGLAALACYALLGALTGALATGVTAVVYRVEDAFERLPLHWMWWPALGAAAVGLVGLAEPRTLGVGYENISDLLSGRVVGGAAAALAGLKFLSWSVSLGSGTSGGTLAPLFTVGAGAGALLGGAAAAFAPGLGVDPRLAALVGMAALFAGASRALLASVVFAFETTLQPAGLLPLLAGCSTAYLVSWLLSPESIMTEKIARRGVMVPAEYAADPLEQVRVSEAGLRPVVTLRADDTLAAVRAWLAAGASGARHQGFPVLDEAGRLAGVLTRRDILDPARDGSACVAAAVSRPPVVVHEDRTMRDAADLMVEHDLGRLPVVSLGKPARLLGIVTRSDVLAAYRRRLAEGRAEPPHITLV